MSGTIRAFYRFEKLPNSKSAYRLDCVARSGISYAFERLRREGGELFVYFGDSSYTKAGQHGRTGLAISNKGLISSIFIGSGIDNKGYGDIKGTADALLFNLEGFKTINGKPIGEAYLDVFVIPTYAAQKANLYQRFCRGEFDDNIRQLLSRAVYENTQENVGISLI